MKSKHNLRMVFHLPPRIVADLEAYVAKRKTEEREAGRRLSTRSSIAAEALKEYLKERRKR